MKTCLQCDTPVTGRRKYCNNKCRARYYYTTKYPHLYLKARIKKGQEIGVGIGGKTGTGTNNQNYKNGLGILVNGKNRILRRSIRYCENCRVDLKYVSRGRWGIHHKDHDRTNNADENLQLLCRSCHAKHHETYKHFEGATTIP